MSFSTDDLRASHDRATDTGLLSRPFLVLLSYVLLAVVATWPLSRGLARDVPGDLGDPLLNMWALAWDCEQLMRILGGDIARIAGFFNANIFYPTPLTLAYSEHLIAQAIQILPVYAMTGNPILSYNILFLSTWALSGFGVYLLVRELTGCSTAAFVAGLLYGFAPYRVSQSGHLQILSSQWMPFALYGLRRYFDSRSRLPLAGAVVALTLQGLSSGYYLLFFLPMAGLFALWEVSARRLWRQWRIWRDLALSGVSTAALILPFLLPYATLRDAWASRDLSEVVLFSADVYSYATAFPGQRVWGSVLRSFPKEEGDLFPGLVPVLLALLGLVTTRGRGSTRPDAEPVERRWLTWLLSALVAGHVVAAGLALVWRRITFDAGWFVIRIRDVDQMLLRAAVSFGVLLVFSPRSRARIGQFMRDRGFFLVGLLMAVWLSLGPMPEALGRPVDIASPYKFLYDHVPGFDGLRVAARFAMLAALMLSVIAGFGAQAVARWRGGTAVLIVSCGFFMFESTSLPFRLNVVVPPRELNSPEARVMPPQQAPAVYQEVARQPDDSVLAELPLGEPSYDLRAVYYSSVHWRPLLNGYSGFFPPTYGLLAAALSEIPRHPDVSLGVLRSSRVTHVIIHEAAYRDGEGEATSKVLRDAGAEELLRDGSDVLVRLSLDSPAALQRDGLR